MISCPPLLKRPSNFIIWLFSALVSVLVWVHSIPQLGGPGMTWDEAFYYPTFLDVQQWTRLLVSDPREALSSDGIKAGWGDIEELPPVVKWLGAATTFIPAEGWWRLAAIRIFPTLAFGCSIALLLLIGRRLLPGAACWLPALFYMSNPIVLGHAQIAATETVFALVTLLVIHAALSGLDSWYRRFLLAVLCGVALATKVNGLILIMVVGTWLLLSPFLGRHGVFSPSSRVLARNKLLTLIILPSICVIVAFLLWPWIWQKTGTRLYDYWLFIRHHEHQGIWFLGQQWNSRGPMAPVWYPMAILHFTTPILLLVAGWIGILTGLYRCIVVRFAFPPAALLLGMMFLAPLLASSLPGTPKYDSTRLFFPIYAPAAILTAWGLVMLRAILRRRNLRKRLYSAPRWLAPVAIAIVLLASARFPRLDYFNSLAPLVQRDESFPFEQTWWCNAINKQVIDDLNAKLPPNAALKTLALQPLALEIIQQWGVLRADIQINPDPPYAAHLIQNRRGFWGNAEYSIIMREPLATWGVGQNDEPLVYLFDGRPPG